MIFKWIKWMVEFFSLKIKFGNPVLKNWILMIEINKYGIMMLINENSV